MGRSTEGRGKVGGMNLSTGAKMIVGLKAAVWQTVV
jgi:hypothetical protein